jgi:hypothetical protein
MHHKAEKPICKIQSIRDSLAARTLQSQSLSKTRRRVDSTIKEDESRPLSGLLGRKSTQVVVTYAGANRPLQMLIKWVVAHPKGLLAGASAKFLFWLQQ